jgi:hypothetical protein
MELRRSDNRPSSESSSDSVGQRKHQIFAKKKGINTKRCDGSLLDL